MVLKILLGMTLLSVPVDGTSRADTIEVLVEGRADSPALEQQVLSYFRGELRSKGDIAIAPFAPAVGYTIKFLAMEETSPTGGAIGYVISAVLTRGCLTEAGTFPNMFPALASWLEASRDSALVESIEREIHPFVFWCREPLAHRLASLSRSPDWRGTIGAWVAEWDTEYFEAHR